jgi:hypothetical protein
MHNGFARRLVNHETLGVKAGLIKLGILFLDANFAKINFTKVP